MRRLAALACLLPLTAACSGSLEIGPEPTGPQCSFQAGGRPADPTVVLMAQSVPSSSLLPCIRTVPAGWRFEHIEVTDRGTHFWLNSARDGTHALAVVMSRNCDVADAKETSSEQAGTRRYERGGRVGAGYRGQRYYVYPGGCITYDFNLRGTTGAEPMVAVSQALGFITRDAIARMVHDNTDGRFTLDPPSARAGR